MYGKLCGEAAGGYVIRPIDELYRRILSEEWSHDLCSQFRDEGHFMQMGVGFVALWGEEIAGGGFFILYIGGD
ncbi:MAG: GNAT family N-acetyltransferase [Eisenbergiella sp.]